MSLRAVAAGALALVCSTPTASRAERSYSVGLFGGYAAEANSIKDTLSSDSVGSKYRSGVGVRAGVSIPKLYFGLAFTHHFGTNVSATGVGATFDSRYHATYLGPEIGYDATFGKYLMMRPYIGAGVLFEYARTTLNGVELNDDRARFQVTPGLIIGANVGKFMVGVDLRVVVSPIADPARWAPGAFLTLGYRF